VRSGFLFNKLFLTLLLLSSFFLLPSKTFASNISVDQSYGTGGEVITSLGNNSFLSKIAVQSDGKIVAVGYKSNGNDNEWVIVRYNTNGTLDNGFGVNGIVTQNVTSFDDVLTTAIIQPDGKIVVGGFSKPNDNYLWTLARYDSDGIIDNAFGNNGFVTTSFGTFLSLIKDIKLDSNNKIIAIGYAHEGTDDVAVARYNPDGSLDTTFSNQGVQTTDIGGSNDRGNAALLLSDNKIVVLGDFDAGGHDDIFLDKYNNDGSLDQTFGNHGIIATQIGSYDSGSAIALQNDGKLVVTGETNITSLSDTYLARYNSSGFLDTSFGNSGKVINSFSAGNDGAHSLIIQQDGGIILGGYGEVNSKNLFMLSKFNNNGSLDTSFGNNGIFSTAIGQGSSEIYSIIKQADGKIITAGFTSGSNYNNWALVRYTNGSTTLPVPYFNQQSSPWGTTEYDHADSLGFTPSTMIRWGCAVTSAAMVLKSYGMNQLPDGTPLDPGSLNTWFNNNNGYLTGKDSSGNYSYLDWTTIGTLAREAKTAGKSPTDVMVKVVRKPTANSFSTISDTDFAQQIPDIIETHNSSTSGHFVVTTGKTDDSYTINDPFWNSPSLNSFNNNIDEVVRLQPSHTDLSYITLVVDPTVNILVTDANGEREGNNGLQSFDEVNNAVYGLENPIGSPEGNTTLGNGVNRLLLPLPTNGLYNIVLSSNTPQTFTLNASTMQTDGTSELKIITGIIGPQDQQTFSLNYSKNGPSSIAANPQITFQSTLADIQILYAINSISLSSEKSLSALINNASQNYMTGRSATMQTLLTTASQLLQNDHSKGIVKDDAFSILNQDFSVLKELL